MIALAEYAFQIPANRIGLSVMAVLFVNAVKSYSGSGDTYYFYDIYHCSL